VRYHAIEMDNSYWGVVDTQYIPWHAKHDRFHAKHDRFHFKLKQEGLTEENAKVLAKGLNFREEERAASRG
jgi:hypothetical protein